MKVIAFPRRQFLALSGSALTVAGTGGLLAIVLGFKGCGSTPAVLSKRTAQVIAALTEARQVFVDANLSQVVTILDKALEVAKLLKQAFDAGNNGNALTYLAQLLAPDGILQSIALAVGLLQNEAQRRVVATVLIVARLALNLIAAEVNSLAVSKPGTKERAIAAGRRKDVETVETAADAKLLGNVFELAYGVKLQ